jgi:hypothetical protein
MSLPVAIEVLAEQDRAALQMKGWTRDVSNAGVFFWAPGAFAVGQKLRLILEVGIDSVYNCSLEIRWDGEVIRAEPGVRESGVAVRILQFDIPKVVTYPITLQN